MGITINIKVDKREVLDTLDDTDCTLSEVGVAILRLKQIELKLVMKEFESKFEMEEQKGN